MHHGVSQIENEGLFGIAFLFEPSNRFFGVKSGELTHVSTCADRLVVLMKFDDAAVVGTERTEVVIKTLSVWHAFNNGLTIRDIPLTNACSLVAHLTNQFRPRNFRGRHPPAFAA